jgi:tetratricopeptide (TPR) repeat protein
MRNYIGYINDYSDGNLNEAKRKWFEQELLHNEELKSKYLLFRQVNRYMQSKFDLEEVINDPDRPKINDQTRQMVSDFNQNPNKFNNSRSFIEIAFNPSHGFESNEKHKPINQKVGKDNVNDITKQWVEEWNVRNLSSDLENESRKAYIKTSLETKSHDILPQKQIRINPYTIRIVGLVAAATIGVFILIKTLNPSPNHEELYLKYYQPLEAFSTTTRSSNTSVDLFSDAIGFYKEGQYKSATAIFSDLVAKEPSNIHYQFFKGISLLELGDFNQAIALLNKVVTNNQEFKKEAQWYLGLSYLKTNNIEKAIACFKELSYSKGHYQTKANDLLKRLE